MRKWILLLTLTSTLLPLAVAHTSASEDDKPDKAAAFQRIDKNGDGAVSLDEFTAKAKGNAEKSKKLESRFKRLDDNGDGKLSPEELGNASGKKGGKKKGDDGDE